MAAKIQDADVKGTADVTADSRLINDNKIYVASLSKRFDQAVAAGDFATGKDSADLLSNHSLTASVSSNALTIALKTKAGTDPTVSDPVKVAFRNATVATGDFTVLTITAALSITVSAGSTLGMISGNNSQIWVYLFNDAGTPRLGVSQTLFHEEKVRSSTAEGGAGGADSNRLIYTGTAVTSKAIRVIGLMRASNTTGNWTSVPDVISVQPLLQQNCAIRYTSSAGQTLTNDTLTVIDFNSRRTDPMGLVSGSGTSWVYTCPSDGYYVVAAHICFDNGAAWDGGERRFMTLKKNGTSETGRMFYQEANSTSGARLSMVGCQVIDCAAGDTLAVAAQQTSAASLAVTANDEFNTISIFKINESGII